MTNRYRILAAARRRRRAKRSLGLRAGFTVVEIIVAIMVLSIGVLGLASTAAVVQRQMASGERQSAAAAIAQSRFDMLTSVNCQSLAATTGTATWRHGHVKEEWTVSAINNNVRQITETITLTSYKKPLVYTTSIPCRL